jgi:lipoprotein signal peptidase
MADRRAAREPHLDSQGARGGEVAVGPAAAAGRDAGSAERGRQGLIVLAVLTAVIAIDQAVKWWAWRHIAGADINPGGDTLTGPTIGRLYAQPVSGALLDLADFGWVSFAAAALALRPRPTVLTICGSLMVGGWASNLLDRLGMHYWTAPGSVRGAVDFISMGGTHWNLADFVIMGATPLFLLVAACLAARDARRRALVGQPASAPRISLRPPIPVAAAATAVLGVTVALGAVHYGGLTRPVPPAGTRNCLHPRTTQTLSSSGDLVTQTVCQRPWRQPKATR